VVEAPEELRIERVMKRGGVNREQVLERMKNQMPQEEKVALADYVIHNDLQQSVITQVLAVHENLILQSNQAS
jgi:dephospho-CoA kinase